MLEFIAGKRVSVQPLGATAAVTSDTTHLAVTIVSTDRALLRELSWTLSLFGYQVTTSSDFGDEAIWRQSAKHGFLLLDTRDGTDVDEILALPRTYAFNYRVAIGAGDATERLLLKGADDVIRHPVNTGELLTRLRAGVRRLEFEHRLAARGRRDATTGLLTRQSLEKKVDRSAQSSSEGPTSVIVCGIDHLPLIREQYGSHAVRHLTTTLARCLERGIVKDEHCGVLGENVFVASLRRTTEEARQFAASLAKEFAACDTLVREIRSLPSLSATVAEWTADVPAKDQFDSLQLVFEQVQSYGGSHTVLSTDVQQAIATWRANMDAGVPFEDVVAQDMMELFPMTLTTPQVEAGFVAAIAAPQQLRVPCIPVVDDAGQLVGEVQVGQVSDGTVPTCQGQPEVVTYSQPLNELFEAFSSAQSEYLVVVDDNRRPVGYVTCEALASLVLDRMDSNNYRTAASSGKGIASLIVPVEPDRAAAEEHAIAL